MIFIYTTLPNKNVARKLGKEFVVRKLAACVNLFPIESVYWWQGKIETDREVGMLIKTQKKYFKKVEKFLFQKHPYITPCIVELPIGKVTAKYKKWLESSTT